MRSLERRLLLLEAATKARSKPPSPPGDLELRRAAAALLDLLEVLFPDPSGQAFPPPYKAAAARIVNGAATPADLDALAKLEASEQLHSFRFATAMDIMTRLASPPLTDAEWRELEQAAAEEAAAERAA